jgi:quinol monooxygenase YgiN
VRYIHVIEATVDPGRMEDFIRTVQIWERDALAHPDGPEHHTVLIDDQDPSQVVLISQFEDEDRWRRFKGVELLGTLQAGVDTCCQVPTTNRSLLVYYAAGMTGPRAIFGEPPH